MFDWRSFLNFAQDINGSSASEAALRSAISRAYYAVYHRASIYVRGHSLVPPTERLTHEKVWSLIELTADPNGKVIGRRGRALKRMRIRADYQTVFPGDLPSLTNFAVGEAQALLDALDQLS